MGEHKLYNIGDYQKKWKYKERLGDMENRCVLPSSSMTFTKVGTRKDGT
jgi:hypothetical protein